MEEFCKLELNWFSGKQCGSGTRYWLPFSVFCFAAKLKTKVSKKNFIVLPKASIKQ